MALGVEVDFTANVAKFSNQVDKITGQIDGFSRKTQQSFGLAKTAIKGFVGAFAVSELTGFVKSGIDTADMLSKLSQRTGVAVEDLAGLKLAADLSDTSIEGVGRAINRLSIFTAQYNDEAKQLGITATDTTEQFLQFSDIFRSIESDAQRAAVGNRVLGRSYAELAPLLLQGSNALRQQIEEGKRYLPITAEMARQSEKFNDDLTKLSRTTQKYGILLGGDILNSINNIIERFEAASRAGLTFNNVLASINASEIRNLDVGIDDINDKIVAQREKIKALKNDGPIGGLVDGLLGYDINEEKRKLDLLLREREQIIKRYQYRRDQQAKTQAPSLQPPSQESINRVIASSSGASSSGASRSARTPSRASSVTQQNTGANEIEQLQRQIFLFNQVGEAAKARYDVEFGSLSQISSGNKDLIVSYAEQLDSLTAYKAEYEKFGAQAASVIESIKTPTEDLIQQIDAARALFDKGFLNEDQLKRALDQYGSQFNELQRAAENTFDVIDQYGQEAARNIQSSFANFLYDPFEDGVAGMALSFANAVRRMLAEAASAQILETLLGRTGKNGAIDFSTGLIGSVLAGIFHEGGKVGSAAPQRAVSPVLFAGAPRFHSGTYPGLKGDEFPAILQKGEIVLSRKQVANAQSSSGGGVVNNISVTVQSRQGEDAGALGQRIAQEIARSIAREEIRSAIRPGNILNPTNKI